MEVQRKPAGRRGDWHQAAAAIRDTGRRAASPQQGELEGRMFRLTSANSLSEGPTRPRRMRGRHANVIKAPLCVCLDAPAPKTSHPAASPHPTGRHQALAEAAAAMRRAARGSQTAEHRIAPKRSLAPHCSKGFGCPSCPGWMGNMARPRRRGGRNGIVRSIAETAVGFS